MRVPDIPRSEMTDAQRIEAQRRDRVMRGMRRMGKPLRVLPWEYARAHAKVKDFHDRGMGFRAMSDITGLSRHCLQMIARKEDRTIDRLTYETVMSDRFEFQPLPSAGSRGALVPATGSWRRIEALKAIGFSAQFQADYLGMKFHNLPRRDGGRCFTKTAEAVAEMYSKLHDADPADFGIPQVTITRNKKASVKRRCAPPWCWDDDTIDDPDAFPEWTGACGTDEGYRIHIREGIPFCEACTATDNQPFEIIRMTDYVFSTEKYVRLIKESGQTPLEIASAVGVDRDSVYRWGYGDRNPLQKYWPSIAKALKVSVDDLTEATEVEIDVPLVVPMDPGVFNHTVLAAFMARRRLSVADVARASGVSHTAVSAWVSGKKAPFKSKIQKVAEALGIDWREFYS